jgi:hypothetical protein
MNDRPRRQSDRFEKASQPSPEASQTTARSTDACICRICGERVLDMKYHLGRVHPRPSKGRPEPVQLDHGTEEALRELAGLLEDVRENVFKEPIYATSLIDRAREWVQWAKDRSRSTPPPRGRGARAGFEAQSAKRHVMRVPSKPHG